MTLTIRCDHYSVVPFRRCEAELSGIAFNAKPAGWQIVDLGDRDHYDYCPEHAPGEFRE